MNFSCLPVSLYGDLSAGTRTLGDWFRFARSLGLDGADISVAHVRSRAAAYLAGLRRQAEEAGVAIAMIVTYSDFTHPDVTYRRRQVEELSAHIEIAAVLGARFLRVTAGQAHPGVDREQGIAWAVEGLTARLDEAQAAGVTLCYENHSIGYGWSHFDFSLPAGIFLEIARRTAGSGLQILFDTANNLVTDDDPEQVLAAVQDRVAVVHVSDIRRTGAFEPVLIGTGAAPIDALFRRLRAGKFAGWISVEEASRTGEEGFRGAIATCRRLWDAETS